MISCLKPEIQRCRPLLGTFVEIKASGLTEFALHRALDAAFSVVEGVHRRMSAHDPDSELSDLNRKAMSGPTTVSDEMFQVLSRAMHMAEDSNGAFDFTVAPLLARWGFLPDRLGRKNHGAWREVKLLSGNQVHFMKDLAIDLGGIAKGFAVDAAINTLREHGVSSAVVNAGGDLRVFGPQPVKVCVRHPKNPQTFAKTIMVKEQALATSSSYFSQRRWHFRRVSHLVDLRGKAVTDKRSVTVRARECWLADALTKVVLNAPVLAENLLMKYQAEAFVLTV